MIGLGIGLAQSGAPQEAGFTLASLFAGGEMGYAPDFADPLTLFRDAVGTTPVSASGQAVALLLDKSQGLTLGPERVVNGDFATNLDSWAAPGGGWSWEAGKAKLTGSGSAQAFIQEGVFEIGKTYRVVFEINTSGLGAGFQNASGRIYASGASGTVSAIVTPDLTALVFKRVDGVVNGTLDSVSVREIAGHHAVQATSALLPQYRTGGGLQWLQRDPASDSLPAMLPALGTDATIWFATEGASTILTGQSVAAGAFETLRGPKTYAVGAIDRSLTPTETAGLMAYLNSVRGA